MDDQSDFSVNFDIDAFNKTLAGIVDNTELNGSIVYTVDNADPWAREKDTVCLGCGLEMPPSHLSFHVSFCDGRQGGVGDPETRPIIPNMIVAPSVEYAKHGGRVIHGSIRTSSGSYNVNVQSGDYYHLVFDTTV